jgi:hypothetical protein
MKKIFLKIIMLMLVSPALYAQTAVNTDGSAPDNSAMLEVKSTNKGILLPRVELTGINSAGPVSSPSVGLFVYNTATAGTAPNNVSAGYYYWEGTKWIPVSLPQGANVGDLLRWDGVQWSCYSPANDGMALIVSSGIPSWGYYPDPIPLLLTNSASAITVISATSGGNVSDLGVVLTERGVCWSTAPNPTTSGNKSRDGAGCGTYTSTLTGLAANTKYYIRAYAINDAGTGYGNEVEFTTRDGAVSLTTLAASSITAITAISGGTITDDGGAVATARGICWSTVSGPTTADNMTSNGAGTGTFASNLAGLTANTKYYIRAYATNSVGTSYGNEVSFTTQDGVISLTTTAPCIATVSATSGGNITSDGGAAVTARGVCWSTSPDPTIAGNHSTDGSGNGSYASTLTGLTANTLYYVRAYATNIPGTCYGNQFSFTTSPFTIGQSYGGGIIYYIDCTGQHGLIAATADIGLYHWGCEGTTVGASGTAVGTGSSNTTAIINGCPNPNIAAKVAHDYTGGGYTDWFLPSKDEFVLLCGQQAAVGGFTSWYYWSSSELSSTMAFSLLFPSCAQNNRYKDSSEGDHGETVRPVRAF